MRRKPLASLLRRHLHGFPAKMTLPELARRIGIDARTLKGLMQGRAQPNRRTLEKLAVFLRMPAAELRRRPGYRIKARRLTVSSERAELLLATPLEDQELDRMAESGRAHAIVNAPMAVGALADRVERNLKVVFDGRQDIRAIVFTPEQVEAKMQVFLDGLPALPPLLVYCPLRMTHARYGKRGNEALRAMVLGIIESGWSCLLLPSPFTMTSDVFACWPDAANLPPADTCSVVHDPLEYICALTDVGSSRNDPPGDTIGDALRQLIDRMRSLMKNAPPSSRPLSKEVNAANHEKARIVSAALHRMSSACIGVDQDNCVITLHFRGVRDCQENLNALLLHGNFDFSNGFCTVFPSSSASGNDCRLRLAISSLDRVAECDETSHVAELLAYSLESLAQALQTSSVRRVNR